MLRKEKKYLANFLIRNIVSREIVQLPNIQKKRQKKRKIFIITEAMRDTIIWSDGALTSDVENIWNVINIEKQKKKKEKHSINFFVIFYNKSISRNKTK